MMQPTPPYDAYAMHPDFNALPSIHSYAGGHVSQALEPNPFDGHHYARQYPGAMMPPSLYGPGRVPYTPMQSHDTTVPPPLVAHKPVSNPPPPKEEKVGGVAAHLDYSMDQMVDFVTEMSQKMYGIFTSKLCLADVDMTRSVMSSKPSHQPELRRYVNQVLTSTRLPSSTILLGLHYLTVRLTKLSGRGDYSYGGGNVYALLTTALILASKFLDDNTFQNRSWSDVSNVPVKKLNRYETEWLQDINWDMHFDVTDPKGFALWRRRWQTYQAAHGKNIELLVDTLRKTSIERKFVEGHMPAPMAQYPVQANANAYGHYYKAPNTYWQPAEDHWRQGPASAYSPPSAPETGPTTPEYPPTNNLGYHDSALRYGPMKPVAPQFVHPGAMIDYTPSYEQYPAYGQYCGCNYAVQRDQYPFNYASGQPVVG